VTIRFDAETFHARSLAALESARGLRDDAFFGLTDNLQADQRFEWRGRRKISYSNGNKQPSIAIASR